MTTEADVVIGADGIQSVLQKYVVQPSLPEYSGSRAYRGLIPSAKLPEWRKEAHQTWMGDGKHFMVYPVRSGRLLNYVGFVPTTDETVESWSAIGDCDELAASFEGWDPRVVGLLEKVDTCFWWGLYDRQPLTSWTNRRLALLGVRMSFRLRRGRTAFDTGDTKLFAAGARRPLFRLRFALQGIPLAPRHLRSPDWRLVRGAEASHGRQARFDMRAL